MCKRAMRLQRGEAPRSRPFPDTPGRCVFNGLGLFRCPAPVQMSARAARKTGYVPAYRII